MLKTLRSYFWWTYERGSLHYDVMVTLILLFLFLGPRFIDFKDRPVETVALHSSEVLIKEAGNVGDASRFLYQIRADEIHHYIAGDDSDAAIRSAILRVIEPIAGEVTLEHYEPVRDAEGHIIAYNAWITR
ncbi:hypothetical protein [Edaphobacter modestus]|uniref:Uncharacterized protein n=1 Tax=Edaphobacter modestus TaxID=388466 RepID=A0A4Q7YQK8_9BACT|nr:hypothetical protein [Edaphobacter modestus]RZU39079.1 hypothetical protein BDD14_0407 [Edaphobacter modestus]